MKIAAWPPFRRRKPRQRTLASGKTVSTDPTIWRVVDEYGEIFDICSLAELEEVGIERQWEIHMPYIGEVPWYEEMLLSNKWTIATTRQQRLPVMGTFRGRQMRTLCLTSTRTWTGLGSHATEAYLRGLRSLFDHWGVGTYPTPAALGQALMAQTYGGTTPRQLRPSWGCRQFLLDHMIGGRADPPEPNFETEVAYELDTVSSYASFCATPLPIKSASPFWDPHGLEDDFVTWVARYAVYIPPGLNLPFGPFPVRGENGVVTYPTKPGLYGDGEPDADPLWRKRERWPDEPDSVLRQVEPIDDIPDYNRKIILSREEAELCEQVGCTAVMRTNPNGQATGYGWRAVAPVLRGFAERAFELRQTAPTKQIGDWTKVATVAGIGRLGCHPEIVTLSAIPTNEPEVDQETCLLTNHYVKEAAWPESPYPTQWYTYIVTGQRIATYERMIAEIRSGNRVLASNFDAVFVAYPSKLPLAPGTLGGWRQTELHNVKLPYSRAIICKEKTRTPGLSRALNGEAAVSYEAAALSPPTCQSP